MLFSHRPIHNNDIPLICTFPQNEEELFFLFPKASYPLTPLQLRKEIVSRSDPLVVLLDGEVVGFANFYRWERKGCCSIGNVIVAPNAREMGVGRYLIEQMISIAFSKHQAAETTISCFNQNVTGLLLYPKLGFKPFSIEERNDKQGNRIALIHMRLPNKQG